MIEDKMPLYKMTVDKNDYWQNDWGKNTFVLNDSTQNDYWQNDWGQMPLYKMTVDKNYYWQTDWV